MTLDVRLDVTLKGVDLVASTAFLTLVDKMGYEGRLLGIEHGTRFEFAIDCDDASVTAQAVRKLFSNQSYFYNINKHHFFLDCRWDAGSLTDGTPADVEQLADDATGETGAGAGYRTEVLIEDLDDLERDALGQRLQNELQVSSVRVPVFGTIWHLTLRAESSDAARALTDEIVVTTRRDRGLLLNPNGQLHHIISTEAIHL